VKLCRVIRSGSCAYCCALLIFPIIAESIHAPPEGNMPLTAGAKTRAQRAKHKKHRSAEHCGTSLGLGSPIRRGMKHSLGTSARPPDRPTTT
jgi:hypothetical protein